MDEKVTEELTQEVRENKPTNRFLLGMLCGTGLMLFIMVVAFVGKKVYLKFAYGESAVSSEISEGTDAITRKMAVVEDTIEKYYLEEADGKAMLDGVFSGMVESLDDPYSSYFSQEELEELMQETEGIYYGIGAYVGIDPDTQLCLISGVIEGTPAEEAGLMAGDLIYKVEDTITTGMDTSEVVTLIKGEEFTTVHVTIIRDGEDDYLEFDVERRQIETPTVEQEMFEDGIGYIRITEFDDVTVDQFTEAYAVCKGSDMKGLIIDLRSNPGGSMNAVCDIAEKILPKGLIVYTEDKYGERMEYGCEGKTPIEVPLVVLVDGYSASASEILAGAVKDYEIGTIMGTTTFGKGIVQRVISLSDGSALKLTVSKYFTPNGNDIHGVGIEPDIEVKYDAEAYKNDGTDNQLEAAKEELRKQIQE